MGVKVENDSMIDIGGKSAQLGLRARYIFCAQRNAASSFEWTLQLNHQSI
jgi:hypothetical protein